MSTDILNEDSEDFNGVYLNEFWNGRERSHQITTELGQYVQLTSAQMNRLMAAWRIYNEQE